VKVDIGLIILKKNIYKPFFILETGKFGEVSQKLFSFFFKQKIPFIEVCVV